MVREIVVNRDAATDAAHFHRRFTFSKRDSASIAAARRHARVPRRGDRRERVRAIVRAEQAPAHRAARLALEAHVESAPSPVGSPARQPPSVSKRSTGVQHSRASTRSSAGSPPFVTMSPLAGSVRTK